MAILNRGRSQKISQWTQAFGVLLLSLAFILGLGSYKAQDPSFSTFSSSWHAPRNLLGYLGSWTSDIFYQVFGWGAWIFPVLLGIGLIRWMASTRTQKILEARWWIALTLVILAYCLLADLMKFAVQGDVFPAQGLLGIALASLCRPFFGAIGSYLIVGVLVWFFCMVWWEELPSYLFENILRGSALAWPVLKATLFFKRKKIKVSEQDEAPESKSFQRIAVPQAAQNASAAAQLTLADAATANSEVAPVIRRSEEKADEAPKKIVRPKSDASPRPLHWDLPPLSLLEYPKKRIKGPSQDQLIDTAKKITSALKSFEVEGEVVEISPGPIITMYEFQPAPGIRVQRIMAASTDLAMTLGVSSVRIVAPIPGKSVAGIEVPNAEKEEIVLRDVFEQTVEKTKHMRLPLVLGKDGEGRPVAEDLSRMPHLLVGGATSMGKSVLVNSILTGLLCRFTPDDLRLIIVDPKLVEFKVFEDIPHLLLPIVNDPSDASQALKWAVSETKRRYLEMQKTSSKNIEAYNEKVKLFDHSTLPEGEKGPAKFPHIVIIIDELAELMFTAKKDVEQSIVRLTQLARAAGIHLIMATQRPSADVVTGLIKSNCPSRAALRVASNQDSRIILDCTGAEQLLGRGDMFFTNTGPMGLRRMQSAFVSDGEIEKVCDFWRAQGEPEYREEILAPEVSELDEGDGKEGSGLDPLFKDVLSFAREKGKVSTSLIQRRFQIGYTRAARIMEQLEAKGVVGEQSAAGKPRDVIA